MAFEGNESTGQERSFYIGKANVKVIGINLNAAEKKAKLGYTKEEEPNYLGERDGVRTVRLEFNLETKEGVRFTDNFFVEDKKVVTKDGAKTQMVNDFGQFAYIPNDGTIPDNMSWYKTDGLREAYKGEEELVSFLKTWKDTRAGQKFSFSNFSAMFGGNFTEIKSLVSNNAAGVFVGIKQTFGDDGAAKYTQVIYNKLFVKQYTKADDAPNGKGGVYKGYVNQFTEAIEATRNAGGQLNVFYGVAPYTFTKVDDVAKIPWLAGDNAVTTGQKAEVPAF